MLLTWFSTVRSLITGEPAICRNLPVTQSADDQGGDLALPGTQRPLAGSVFTRWVRKCARPGHCAGFWPNRFDDRESLGISLSGGEIIDMPTRERGEQHQRLRQLDERVLRSRASCAGRERFQSVADCMLMGEQHGSNA
jgi:hypothetical protein